MVEYGYTHMRRSRLNHFRIRYALNIRKNIYYTKQDMSKERKYFLINCVWTTKYMYYSFYLRLFYHLISPQSIVVLPLILPFWRKFPIHFKLEFDIYLHGLNPKILILIYKPENIKIPNSEDVYSIQTF